MVVKIEQSIYSELADFLVSQPSLETIATYKVPMGVQQHIDNLLEKIIGVILLPMNGWNWRKFSP